MSDCCQTKACDLAALPKSQSRVLWIVLAINLIMFVVELTSAWVGDSISLAGDGLDMLGDSLAYASSLYVINRGVRAKAGSAVFKGGLMLGSAVLVLAQCIYRLVHPVTPDITVMGWVGVAALAANGACLYLLTRHKNDDINMSSVWICSRNDIIANVTVIAATGLVFLTGAAWPDIVVGLGLTLLFTQSAIDVLRQATSTLKQTDASQA